MKLPRDIGPVHFVGIGGIGMSGIAEVMVNLGYVVQGSDQAEGANVKRLREKGVKIMVGHAAGNLGDARVLVVSSAIKPDNPELLAARAQRLPVQPHVGGDHHRRAEEMGGAGHRESRKNSARMVRRRSGDDCAGWRYQHRHHHSHGPFARWRRELSGGRDAIV